jgi:AAA ATPase domain
MTRADVGPVPQLAGRRDAPVRGASHARHVTWDQAAPKSKRSLDLDNRHNGRVTDAGTEVVGREGELAAVRSFVGELAVPTALVLEGAPGIGKTTLWEAGVETALSAGHSVLRCRAVAAETQLSFSAIADLLAEALEDALPTLPPPQQRALRVALLVDEPAGPPPDVRAIAAGLLGVLRHACRSTPVLIAIDDVQWLDESSRPVLEFAVRRLRTERVGLLLARRDNEVEPPLGLGRAMAPASVKHVSLGPMSMGALHRMIQARLGVAFSRPVLRRVYASSAGNPFYALEIARALQRRAPVVDPGEPLPVPPTLAQLVQERVIALPDGVRRLLEIVAALYDRRLAAVRELAHEEGLDGTIDDAVAAGVLGVHDERLEFQHPLLAFGVYAGMGPERRGKCTAA